MWCVIVCVCVHACMHTGSLILAALLLQDEQMAGILDAAAKRRNIDPARADRIKQLLGLGG